MFYSSSSEIFKRFSVRDGLAVKLLRAVGIEVAFISSDDSPLVVDRARRLGISHCYTGTTDKVGAAEELCTPASLSLSNMAYLGDDLQDYDLMQRVGVAVAVGDAHHLIKQSAHYICQSPGGKGAFRELAEWLIVQQGYALEEVWQSCSKEAGKENKGA